MVAIRSPQEIPFPETHMFHRFGWSKERHEVHQLETAVAQLSINASTLPTAVTQPHSRRVDLPDKTLIKIIHFLCVRDALSFTATSRRLRRLTPVVYSRLKFFLAGPGSDSALGNELSRIRALYDLLLRRSDYASHLRSIVVRSEPFYQASTQAWEFLLDGFDDYLSRLLPLAPQLQEFSWFCLHSGSSLRAERTIAQVLRLPRLHQVILIGLAGAPNASPRPHKAPICYEDVSIDISRICPAQCDMLLGNNTNLRSLRIMEFRQFDRSQWIYAFMASSQSWVNLQSLSVKCFDHTLDSVLVLLRYCAEWQYCPSLTALSFEVTWHNGLLPKFLDTLPLFRLRRLRLVISTHEHFYPDFTPNVLAQLLMRLPCLEELVVDSQGYPRTKLIPWTMGDLAAALRCAPSLRILTIPAPFVFVPTCATEGGEEDSLEDEDDQEVGGADTNEDEAMDVDLEETTLAFSTASDPEARVAGATSESEQSQHVMNGLNGLPHLPDWSRPLHTPLAIWADEFLDVHLRMQEFQELRFIHNSGGHLAGSCDIYKPCRLIRFGQSYVPDEEPLKCDYDGGTYMARCLNTLEDSREDNEFFWIPPECRREIPHMVY